MTPELAQTYRLRNGALGHVDELLKDGTYYGTVTALGTDLKVRIIWDKDGKSTKRGEAWDLVADGDDIASELITETLPAEYHAGMKGAPEPMARIAAAMERIAAVLERLYEEPEAVISPAVEPASEVKNFTAGGIGGHGV